MRRITAVSLLALGCEFLPPEALARRWATQLHYTVEAVSCYNTECSVRAVGVPQPISLRCKIDHCTQSVTQ